MEIKKEKVSFKTEQEAREELLRIIATDYNICNTTKPCRIYEENNLWYLTSQKKIVIY